MEVKCPQVNRAVQNRGVRPLTGHSHFRTCLVSTRSVDGMVAAKRAPENVISVFKKQLLWRAAKRPQVNQPCPVDDTQVLLRWKIPGRLRAFTSITHSGVQAIDLSTLSIETDSSFWEAQHTVQSEILQVLWISIGTVYHAPTREKCPLALPYSDVSLCTYHHLLTVETQTSPLHVSFVFLFLHFLIFSKVLKVTLECISR